jgi:hypothetical protein
MGCLGRNWFPRTRLIHKVSDPFESRIVSANKLTCAMIRMCVLIIGQAQVKLGVKHRNLQLQGRAGCVENTYATNWTAAYKVNCLGIVDNLARATSHKNDAKVNTGGLGSSR